MCGMDGKVTNIKYFKICNNKYPRWSPCCLALHYCLPNPLFVSRVEGEDESEQHDLPVPGPWWGEVRRGWLPPPQDERDQNDKWSLRCIFDILYFLCSSPGRADSGRYFNTEDWRVSPHICLTRSSGGTDFYL